MDPSMVDVGAGTDAETGAGRGSFGSADPDVLRALADAVQGHADVDSRAVTRAARAPDASHVLLTPQVVVTPHGAEGVARLLTAAAGLGLPVTFRSGGTSLSGQAVTDGVLVDVRRHFRTIEVLDGGLRVRVQGGATLRQVNARLAPFGRKLGPDPASEIACTIGGVVANNSSGMACGTTDNAYRTLDSLVLVLPSGTVLDTGEPDADERLRALEPDLHAGLLRLRDRVRANPESVRILRHQFSMKNTMGYGLNSFLDHSRPVDVLTRLAVGSEGTLCFVAAATFRTVPLLGHAATGLLVFEDLAAATGVLPALVDTAPTTVELLDAVSLRVAGRDPSAAGLLPLIEPGMDTGAPAALLVEYQEGDAAALVATQERVAAVHAGLGTRVPVVLSRDPAVRQRLWKLRKGVYATVAAARPPGSSALLEDVVVPVGELLGTCRSLGDLFDRYGYRDAAVFGHAKDGNVHFMLTDRFEDPVRLEQYRRFTEDMVDLVLGAGGSLKAEHGTGRTMSPFVRRQYGDELYAVMREVKTLVDPGGLLSPGVLLDDDPRAHLRHLKTTPVVDEQVDRCVECGYCEPVCPSKDLTTTPRQRIVVQRALVQARADGNAALVRELERDGGYEVVDTCAVDGMCETACPVHINTGDLVKRLRSEGHGPLARAAARTTARHWAGATAAAAAGLGVAARLPPAVPSSVTRMVRRVAGEDSVPQWAPDLPAGGTRPVVTAVDDVVPGAPVLFPACVGRVFGSEPGAAAALLALAQRVGVPLGTPSAVSGLCCGTPWRSKGFEGAHAVMRDRVSGALSGLPEVPQALVVDASSCAEGLRDLLADSHLAAALPVVDAVDFALEHLVPRLTVVRTLGRVVVHPSCSSVREGRADAVSAVAATFAAEVVVPVSWGCCGFAGDRGMLHPELTASATAAEAAEISAGGYDAYLSSNLTCEIGMGRATGHRFRHVLEVLEECTRPA